MLSNIANCGFADKETKVLCVVYASGSWFWPIERHNIEFARFVAIISIKGRIIDHDVNSPKDSHEFFHRGVLLAHMRK